MFPPDTLTFWSVSMTISLTPSFTYGSNCSISPFPNWFAFVTKNNPSGAGAPCSCLFMRLCKRLSLSSRERYSTFDFFVSFPMNGLPDATQMQSCKTNHDFPSLDAPASSESPGKIISFTIQSGGRISFFISSTALIAKGGCPVFSLVGSLVLIM